MSNSPVTVKKKRFPVTLEQPGQKTMVRENLLKPDWMSIPPKKIVQTRFARTEVIGARGNALDALRLRMVQRLAASGIRNQLVLGAMGSVPRHIFVDAALANQSYEDTSLPIGLEQTISKPSVVARMLDLVMPRACGERLGNVLDIGTGCGYQAAVLSLLASKVCSVERLKGLHERARINLRPLAMKNVHLIYGDGLQGFAAGAPYDVIIAAAGGDEIPHAWLEQLNIGGVLIAPMSSGLGEQVLVKVVREASGWQRTVLDAVQFVPLKSGIA